MDESGSAGVRLGCSDVIMRYATSVDRHDWDGLMAYWADDCVWVRPGVDPMVGPAAARAHFEALEAERVAANPWGFLQRHPVTTLWVDPQDEDHADAIWYAIVFSDRGWTGALPRPMMEPFLVVEYHTSFRRAASIWQIARHEAVHVFRQGA